MIATPVSFGKSSLPGLIVAMVCIIWHPLSSAWRQSPRPRYPPALTLGRWVGRPPPTILASCWLRAWPLAWPSMGPFITSPGSDAASRPTSSARGGPMAFACCAPANGRRGPGRGLALSALAFSPVAMLHQPGLVALGLERALLFGVLVVPRHHGQPARRDDGRRSCPCRSGGSDRPCARRSARRRRATFALARSTPRPPVPALVHRGRAATPVAERSQAPKARTRAPGPSCTFPLRPPARSGRRGPHDLLS